MAKSTNYYLNTSKIYDNLKDLKAAGLIDIDLRKYNPKTLNDNKKLRTSAQRMISRRKDYIAAPSKFAVLNIPKSIANDKTKMKALKSKYQIKNGKLVVPKYKTEKVSMTKDGLVYTSAKRNKANERLLEKKVEPYMNLSDVKNVGDLLKAFKKMKGSDYKISFSYYNNFSTEVFASVEDALLYFMKYLGVEDASSETPLSKTDVGNILKNIQFVSYEKNPLYYGAFITDVKDKRISNKDASKFLKKIKVI